MLLTRVSVDQYPILPPLPSLPTAASGVQHGNALDAGPNFRAAAGRSGHRGDVRSGQGVSWRASPSVAAVYDHHGAIENFGTGDVSTWKDIAFAGSTFAHTAATGRLLVTSGVSKATLADRNATPGAGAFQTKDDGGGHVPVFPS